MSVDDNIVLFSSFTELPESFFQGHCFIGSDYIFSSAGAHDFHTTTGRWPPVGEDGCYCVAEWQSGNFIIGSDFSGYKKLFYYSNNGTWALSNSLVALVNHLRQNNIYLPPNHAQIAASMINNSRWTPIKQLSCYNTIFEGIFLLPSDKHVVIKDGRLTLRANPKLPNTKSYRTSLSEMLNTWISRAETLIVDHRMELTCDLTGGVDSRTIFSIVHYACERLGVKVADAVKIKSNTKSIWVDDFAIAERLADRYGFSINRSQSISGASLSAKDSYELWKQLNLGVYGPIYFPTRQQSPNNFALGGGGAESHRSFYDGESSEVLLSYANDKLRNKNAAQKFCDELHQTFRYLENADGHGSAPLILHYREFRNRCHAGRELQYSPFFAPFGSRFMYDCSNLLDGPSLQRGQINYDIMETLAPELMSYPYDEESKLPDSEIMRHLTVVKVGDAAMPGRIYSGARWSEQLTQSESGKERMKLLGLDFRQARQNPMVIETFGKKVLDKLDVVIDEVEGKGAFRHATDGTGVSAVIAADFAFGSDTRE